MKEYCVYMLRCRDGSYYTGVTNNLEFRLTQHQEGIDPMSYTYSRRPVKLVYSETFREVNDAIAREKQIKNWSKAKKEALLHEDIELLPELAKKKWKCYSE